MDKIKYNTLINLLDDPDNFVYNEVSKNLVDFGESIIPELEKTWENSINDVVQKRIEDIIKQINFETIKGEFEKWLNSDEQDIIEGAFWIAKYQFPDISLLEIKYFLEDIARKIWLEIDNKNTIVEKVKIINYFLFKEYKFEGNIRDPKAVNNYYINKVIESKVGSPILLSIIYIWIVNRLNLTASCVNLPYNTIVAFKNESYYKLINPDSEVVNLYVNPFNSGSILNKKEIDGFLEKINYPKHERFYNPCSNVEIIGALINELAFIYKKTDKHDKLNHLKLLVELTNERFKD